jgi:predicted metal-dependent hydrolase
MTDVIAWPPPYTIRRHPLARHVKLRASRADGLIISAPKRFSEKHIPSILEEHREWIIARLTELQAQQTDRLPNLIDIPAVQQTWKVEYHLGIGRMKFFVRPHLYEVAMHGKIDDEKKCRANLIIWLRNLAEDFLAKELNKISKECGLNFSTVTVRDQKTMWGSCTINAAISLNYKLIFLPYALARHVMLHELCHTQHHNHSRQFWQLVAKHDSQWREHKRQLRHAERLMPGWL